MSFGPIILQVVLIFLNAVFASAEIAVISMNETKLKKMAADGDSRAARLAALTRQPARFLATIQVAITLAGLLGSAFAAENFAGLLVAALVSAGIAVPEQVLKVISLFFITLILAYFNIVFGELVPKRIAMKKAEFLALALSGLLTMVSKAFAPLVFLLTASTNGILRLFGIDPEEEDEKVSEEEIRLLLAAGNEQGSIGEQENELIQNVFEFDDLTVEQICTHRVDVAVLYAEDGMDEWENMIHSSRHTHYPICGKSNDDIIGVLDTRDYFRLADRSRESVMKHAVDKASFVPERMKANILFRKMKNSKSYFAVVMDEYGGMSGIITLHDLIEALVGDLDEPEEPSQPEDIVKAEENVWKIQGSALLAEVQEKLGVKLPTGEFDTYGGYICGIIDRIPNDGEVFECDADGLRITVHSVKNHRIGDTSVRLEKPEEDKA